LDEALYLIRHRVRDEVVIDLAQRWLLGCGKEIWIVLTSGERAYPFEATPLSAVAGEMMVRATLPSSPHPHSRPHRQA
jgi:hypothetical protein